MKKYFLILLLISGIFISCGNSKETVSDDTLTIGVLAPLTGVNAEFGKGFEVATQMAADRINEAGGINGRKIQFIVKDSKGDQKESSDLARKFVDDKRVLAIIGDFSSGACMANAPIVDEGGLVQLSPTASNPDYAGMSDYCFSIVGRSDVEAPFFAKYVLSKYLGSKKVGVIYVNNDWGKAAYDNFAKQAKKDGLEIVETVSYVQDEKDFSSLITKLRAANPDTIFIMDQGAVSQIINQIRAANYDVRLTTLGVGTSQQLIDLCGKNAEGLLTTSPFFFDPEVPELINWQKEFVSKTGFEATVHAVLAYDCVLLLAEAIKNCGDDVTRKNIRDNLIKIEMNGITGPIKFNPEGDIARNYLICGVRDGKFIVEKGFDYAQEQ